MSIIILTPPPKKPGTTTNDAPAPVAAVGTLSTDVTGLGHKLESAFLHMIGFEGHQFDSWEAVRDFAAAQIAADAVGKIAANPPAPDAQP